jgi:hypothetical protein
LLNFKFVVRSFAFCGQTIQNIDLVGKTKVVWLEILNNLVPFNILLEKNNFLDFFHIISRNFKFVVRFFAFCGQAIQNIDLIHKTKVVWLEILNNIVPFNILLEKHNFLDVFHIFSSNLILLFCGGSSPLSLSWSFSL